MLHEVGLGYVKVGQPATTLSGGEAQRVKLAKELSRRATGKTLYILDEPTTGLHFEDVRKLLEVLHRLVETGNTVVVIEHNLDVIKTADWVIDLGPGGGVNGGRVSPKARRKRSSRRRRVATGMYLGPLLERASVKPVVVDSSPAIRGRSPTRGPRAQAAQTCPERRRRGVRTRKPTGPDRRQMTVLSAGAHERGRHPGLDPGPKWSR